MYTLPRELLGISVPWRGRRRLDVVAELLLTRTGSIAMLEGLLLILL
jgi:hypothetical protein